MQNVYTRKKEETHTVAFENNNKFTYFICVIL